MCGEAGGGETCWNPGFAAIAHPEPECRGCGVVVEGGGGGAAAAGLMDVIRKLERKDVSWDRFYDLEPADVGDLVRNQKHGKNLYKLVHQLPRLGPAVAHSVLGAAPIPPQAFDSPDEEDGEGGSTNEEHRHTRRGKRRSLLQGMEPENPIFLWPKGTELFCGPYVEQEPSNCSSCCAVQENGDRTFPVGGCDCECDCDPSARNIGARGLCVAQEWYRAEGRGPPCTLPRPPSKSHCQAGTSPPTSSPPGTAPGANGEGGGLGMLAPFHLRPRPFLVGCGCSEPPSFCVRAAPCGPVV